MAKETTGIAMDQVQNIESDAIRIAKMRMQQKSIGFGLLLTLLFGGFGVFYFSTLGGIVCSIIEVVAVLTLVLFTLGLGLPLLFFLHLVFVLYTAVAINSHNKRLLRAL